MSRRERRLAERRVRRWRLLGWLGPVLFGVLFVVVGLALVHLEGATAGYAGEEVAVVEPPADAGAPVLTKAPPEPRPEGEPRARGQVATERSEPRSEPREADRFDAEGLRREIQGIVAGHDGRFGVVVYDPESGKTVDVGGGESFYAASIAKLPAFLTLYKEAARGELSLDESISMQPADVTAFGTGELYKYPVGYSLSLRKCAWYLVNKSDNTAWIMLNRRLGMEAIKAELDEIGARDTAYADGYYETTPEDVLKMLQKISDPSYTNERLSKEMLDAMTNTAFEDRLPAGLPEGTRVAHKIGSYGSNFGDAGVVYYRDERGRERHFYVVVMSGETLEPEAVEVVREVARASYREIAEKNE